MPEAGAEVDLEALLQVCRDNLARFKVPKLALTIDADALPRTLTGKVQKFRLVQLARERSAG